MVIYLFYFLNISFWFNGNPLQYSCLENPVDRGAWWAAVHGVAQSWARLNRLSMHACIISIFLISSLIFIFVKTIFFLSVSTYIP